MSVFRQDHATEAAIGRKDQIMKRRLTVFLVFLCIVLTTRMSVFAENNAAALTVRTNANKVYVTLSTAELYYGIQGILTFDSSLLRFDSAETAEALTPYNKIDDSVLLTDEGVMIILAGKQKGDWITISFTAIAGASGTAVLALKDLKTVDGTGVASEDTAESVSVVLTALIGDANGDGDVNICDLVRMKKYLASRDTVEIVTGNADCDRDGVIDTGDLVSLRKILLAN